MGDYPFKLSLFSICSAPTIPCRKHPHYLVYCYKIQPFSWTFLQNSSCQGERFMTETKEKQNEDWKSEPGKDS